MVSNGRSVSSTGCVSGAGMGDAHTGVQCQWADKTGVLSAAWNLRKELLLLAQEAADANGRSCVTSAGALGVPPFAGGYPSDPIPGGGTETSDWCGYGYRGSLKGLHPGLAGPLRDCEHEEDYAGMGWLAAPPLQVLHLETVEEAENESGESGKVGNAGVASLPEWKLSERVLGNCRKRHSHTHDYKQETRSSRML